MASPGLLRVSAGSACAPACVRAPHFSASCIGRSATQVRAQQRDAPTWGEEAPGTGLRHAPEQAADTPLEDDAQRRGNFEMRSTAEVYKLFERLQQQRQSSERSQGVDAVDFREAAAAGGPALDAPEDALRSGPLTGRRRRPGVVNSGDFAEDDRTSGFDMRSTAEVYQLFEKWQQRNLPGEPLPAEIANGDCHAG